MNQLVGMIDAGFLTRAASPLIEAEQAVIEGDEIVRWLKIVSKRLGRRFLRAYWYDGAYSVDHRVQFEAQKERFKKLEECSGLQLRLGRLERRRFDFKPALRTATSSLNMDYEKLMKEMQLKPIFHQKGVDTLIVLDMMRLVQQQACDTIVLIAGDGDLAEAVRNVQNLGATVVLAHPEHASVSPELRDLADDRVILTPPLVEMLTTNVADRQRSLFEKVLTEAGYGDELAGPSEG